MITLKWWNNTDNFCIAYDGYYNDKTECVKHEKLT